MLLRPSTATFKTLRHSRIKDIFRGNFLQVSRHSAVDIAKSASLDLHGTFWFGARRIKGSKLESRLLVEDNATLVTEGPVKVFRPLLRREAAALRETESFLSRVYQGSLSMMVSTLSRRKALSQKEIDELYALLKEAEVKKDD